MSEYLLDWSRIAASKLSNAAESRSDRGGCVNKNLEVSTFPRRGIAESSYPGNGLTFELT